MAVSVTTVSAIATASGTSVTITKPTGLAVGDLLIAHLKAHGSNSIVSNDWTVPSGWTRDASADNNTFNTGGGTGVRANVMYKIADSSDAAASTFAFTFGASTNLAGALFRVTGQSPSVPIPSVNTAATAGDSNDSSPKAYACGVTPTVANSLIMIFVSGRNSPSAYGSYAIATSDPGSWNEAYDSNNIAAAYVNRTQTTATGDVTISWSGSNVGNVLIVFAISPAVGVTIAADLINATGAVLAPTVTGGATVSPSVINSTATVLTPTDSGQADWSPKSKSTTDVWTNINKS